MKIKVDFGKVIGKIKPMHGVGQPPFIGTDFSAFSYLKEAGVPFSRLHDVGGAFGGNLWVDIPNLFRDFSLDPTKEENYDFTFTDMMITALIENGVEPFFRLGVTIENFASMKAYRIYPPEDYQKWAIICQHVIRHYTQGWANGYCYDIRCWEIWNEPDNYEDPNENQMWRGTKEQFYELYGVCSKHLKNCFPNLKIGGYGSCGFYDLKKSFIKGANSSPRFEYFIEFFNGFLDYIKANDCPLDFFSWHSYDGIENNKVYANYARERLDEIGYTHTETTCNEWHCGVGARGTARHAALTCGMMLALQDTPLDSAMFYDARIGVGVYGGLFDPMTKKPLISYYSFKAFNKLYKLKNQVLLEFKKEGVYAVGAKGDSEGVVVIANTTPGGVELDIDCLAKIDKCYLTTDNSFDKEIAIPEKILRESVLTISFKL